MFLGLRAHLNDVPVKAQPLKQPDLVLKLLQVGLPCVVQDFDGHVLAPVLEAAVHLQQRMANSSRGLHCQGEEQEGASGLDTPAAGSDTWREAVLCWREEEGECTFSTPRHTCSNCESVKWGCCVEDG